jgi:hypothetical protein
VLYENAAVDLIVDLFYYASQNYKNTGIDLAKPTGKIIRSLHIKAECSSYVFTNEYDFR